MLSPGVKTRRCVGLLVALSALLAGSPQGAVAAETPIEIGQVAWLRDLDEGLALAKTSGKPVFLLFQEVPGCSGCQEFGKVVLSDLRMVSAIESHFVPVFIPNNQPGKAADVLKRYAEPAWNFQVVRFLDARGRDLIPRRDKVWTVPALAERMVLSLEKAGRPIDPALQTLAGRPSTEPAEPAAPLRKVAFAQACFWTGEMQLGQIEGVRRTEAGFYEGREVTLVEYDPQRLALADLIKQAMERRCADRIYTVTPEDEAVAETVADHRRVGPLDASYRAAPASDQKRQIQGTPLEGRPMTPEQATKINAFIRTDPRRAERYLAED